MIRQPEAAAVSTASRGLIAPGALIAASFWAIGWLEPRAGEPAFMAALGLALLGYLWAAMRLSAAGVSRPSLLVLCFIVAIGWRLPLLTLPETPAHDAVRYIWDARAVRAGLNPYDARPDDPSLQELHSEVTRTMDASWLPTPR